MKGAKPKPKNRHKSTNNTKEWHKDRHVEGIIHISHKGIGTLRIKTSNETVEVDHSFLHTACNGDTVRVILHPKKRDSEQTGEVSAILRRSKKGFSGILEREH